MRTVPTALKAKAPEEVKCSPFGRFADYMVARLLDLDHLSTAIDVDQPANARELGCPFANFLLYAFVAEFLHAPRIEDHITRLVERMANVLLDDL